MVVAKKTVSISLLPIFQEPKAKLYWVRQVLFLAVSQLILAKQANVLQWQLLPTGKEKKWKHLNKKKSGLKSGLITLRSTV